MCGVKDEIERRQGVHKLLVGDRITRGSGRRRNKLELEVRSGRHRCADEVMLVLTEKNKVLASKLNMMQANGVKTREEK